MESQKSIKEGLGAIRDRMQARKKDRDWKKLIAFATAVGAVGAVALSRRLLIGSAKSNLQKGKVKIRH